MLQAVATVVRTLVSLAFLGVVGAGGWIGYRTYSAYRQDLIERDREIEAQAVRIGDLEAEVAAKQREIERLDLALRLSKVERRRAQVAVLDQEGSRAEGTLRTQVRFVEVDEGGSPVGEPRTLTLEGDLLYVDAWVVKYADELVEEGADPLRSASLCLFRRLFGEHQQPAQGVTLDNPLERPEVYGGPGAMPESERRVWERFWEIANDPKEAAALGIRAAHGEAPSIQLQKGKVYEITLRASGGLTIQPTDTPAVLQG